MSFAPPIPATMPAASYTTGFGEAPPALPVVPPGNAKKVKDWLLKWLHENATHAREQTKLFHLALQQAELDFKGDQYPPSAEQSKQLGTEIKFEEHKNQVNIATATMIKNMQRAGRTYRYQAINGEIQSRADATQALVDSQLEECNWVRELCRFWLRLNKHDAACMKLTCDYRDVIEPRQYQVLVENAPDHMAAMGAAGVPFSIVSDGSDGSGQVVLETPQVQSKMKIGAKCVDMRNLAVSDPLRPDIQTQQSIHEFHIFTEDELEDNTMFLIDWGSLGEPNANNRHHIATNYPSAVTGTMQTPKNFRQWEVTESHQRIPWMRQIQKRTFNQADLLAFWMEVKDNQADEAQRMVSECSLPQKWIAHHIENRQLFKLDPTYCPDKNSYPYRGSSFVDGDSELFGQSQMRQVMPMSNGMNAAIQQGLNNARIRGDISCFYDTNANVNPDSFADLYSGKNKAVPVDFGGRNPKDALVFVSDVVPDTWETCARMYALCRSEARSFGVPEIIQAGGNADTATQDSINNERGQAKLDYPFLLAVLDVVLPILRDIGLLVFKHFDEPRMIQVAGEAGAEIGRYRMVTRDQITNRFKVVPMATFDFVSGQAKANAILQALNIISRAPGDPLLMKWAAKFLEYMGEDRQDINDLTNNVGEGSNAEDEINVLCYNPDERMQDRLRPDDDPFERLQLIARIMGNPQVGIPPSDPDKAARLAANPNFDEYVQKLISMKALLVARATGAVPPKPGTGPQGGGGGKVQMQPNPAPPQSAESQVRSSAQMNSAGDNGGNTTGLTGRAVVGAQ